MRAPTPPAWRDGVYLGLMSGTSADGIDAALVRFAERPQLLAASSTPYPDDLRAALLDAAFGAPLGAAALAELDQRVGACFADAALALLQRAGLPACSVAAIGSHGQTLCHRPHGPHPFTQQLGDPHLIAERTGLTTVADFRRRDVAAGGHGAPLAPAFHAAVLSDPAEPRAVLNLGGIANLTRLQPGLPVIGFDTGPANGLMDAWAQRHLGTVCDIDGALAARGTVDAHLLDRLLADPYVALPPPKSTGRDHFTPAWLDHHLQAHPTLGVADVQATLLAFTVESITHSLRRWLPGTARVIACGGGVRNPVLMQALQAALAPARLDTTAAHGLDPDMLEAVAFAWLARQTLLGLPGNLPDVTGALGPRILGAIIPGGGGSAA